MRKIKCFCSKAAIVKTFWMIALGINKHALISHLPPGFTNNRNSVRDVMWQQRAAEVRPCVCKSVYMRLSAEVSGV